MSIQIRPMHMFMLLHFANTNFVPIDFVLLRFVFSFGFKCCKEYTLLIFIFCMLFMYFYIYYYFVFVHLLCMNVHLVVISFSYQFGWLRGLIVCVSVCVISLDFVFVIGKKMSSNDGNSLESNKAYLFINTEKMLQNAFYRNDLLDRSLCSLRKSLSLSCAQTLFTWLLFRTSSFSSAVFFLLIKSVYFYFVF